MRRMKVYTCSVYGCHHVFLFFLPCWHWLCSCLLKHGEPPQTHPLCNKTWAILWNPRKYFKIPLKQFKIVMRGACSLTLINMIYWVTRGLILIRCLPAWRLNQDESMGWILKLNFSVDLNSEIHRSSFAFVALFYLTKVPNIWFSSCWTAQKCCKGL